MANVKITELTNLTDPSTTDVMPVVDVDADVTKKVSIGEVIGKISGDVDVATNGTSSIAAGVIVDADINDSAEIAVSKLANGAARQLLQTDADGTGVEWTDDVDVPGTLDVTGATTLDSTLGVNGQSTLASAAVSDLTEDRVVIAGASGELEDSANLTFDGSELGVTGTLDVSSNATVGGDLTVTGDLTVEGTTTTIETTTLLIEDKNIEMGVVDTPTDTTADGGGITLKGATDKTINWVDATDAWTFSEHVELASGKEFYIDGNGVLNATTLGSGVVNSSLTSVGTIGTGTWQGTAIDATYLDPTVVTTSDTGTVTSTMILDGTIVNGDINATAAIAGTKIDPDFGSQTVETTGDLAINTDVLFVDSAASAVGIGTAVPSETLTVKGASSVDPFSVSGPSSEFLRVDDSGRLLVGTSTSTSGGLLQVRTNSSTDKRKHSLRSDWSQLGYPVLLQLDRSLNNGAVTNNAYLGSLVWRGHDGTDMVRAASVQAQVDGTPGTNDMPGRLVFSVTADGSASPTEALRISNDRSITVSDGGDVVLGTTTGTKIGTATSQKIGFYNATPVVQPTAVADITTTATSGSLPTPDGSVTIADATTPTVTELLEYCVELEAKLEAALGHLRTLGLIAT